MKSRRSSGIRCRHPWAAVLALLLSAAPAWSDVKLPALFTDHMVLQRDLANPVWGTAGPGEQISVTINGQTKKTQADGQGNWRVVLEPMKIGPPTQMVIQGANRVTLDDVLLGEVWVCSGQSNMQMSVDRSNDADLERLSADWPQIRLISVPRIGTQTAQTDFDGKWERCSPETVGGFTAAGYFFGRTVHKVTGVPVGLIHCSWGGSSCEAWVPRPLLEKDAAYGPLIERWQVLEKRNGPKDAGQLRGQHRPGNLYQGMLHPIIGYGIRGATWYQGESNAARAYQYRALFPLMITAWRDAWKQGDFPFYWVQLADFRPEVQQPGDSTWAELREAQTMTLNLPHTGQAVIIDVGESNDIHPKDKQTVGRRLARWALAKDYGVKIASQSAQYQSMEVRDDKIVISFEHVDGQLKPFDTNEIRGFTIAGQDRKFAPAQAKIVGKARTQIEVSSPDVKQPVAVRYAWADNPVCNLRSTNGLPVTPFRTDQWPGVTADAK